MNTISAWLNFALLIMCWAEEHDLLIRYGEPYAEYMRNTGAFWPKRGS